MLRLRWSERGIRNLEEIIAYIADRNYSAAMDLEARIVACAERLPDHPFMYRAGRLPGTREAVVHPNYIMVYRVDADEVEILGVIHSRRRYPPTEADEPK